MPKVKMWKCHMCKQVFEQRVTADCPSPTRGRKRHRLRFVNVWVAQVPESIRESRLAIRQEKRRQREAEALVNSVIELFVAGMPNERIKHAKGIKEHQLRAILNSWGGGRFQALKRLRRMRLRGGALEICRKECERLNRALTYEEITKFVPREKRQGTPVHELRRALIRMGFSQASRHFRIFEQGKMVLVPYARYRRVVDCVQKLYIQGFTMKYIKGIVGLPNHYIIRALRFDGMERYAELKALHKVGQVEKAIQFCKPICLEQRRTFSKQKIGEIVPIYIRYGLDLAAVASELEKLGFPKSQPRKYSNQQMLDHLIELAQKLGRTPTFSDLRQAGTYHPSMYLKYFGGLSTAQQLAGLRPYRKFKAQQNHLLHNAKKPN